MRKLIFEKDTPSCEVLIDLRETGILKWLKYITNRTFHKEGVYEELITEIENNHQDKILVVVNDNSNHGYIKRCYICVYTEDELKS